MRKLREVLRLRYELKLGYQQIGRSCSIGVSTVHDLKRAEATGVTDRCQKIGMKRGYKPCCSRVRNRRWLRNPRRARCRILPVFMRNCKRTST